MAYLVGQTRRGGRMQRQAGSSSANAVPGLTDMAQTLLDTVRRGCGDHLPHCHTLQVDGHLFVVQGLRRGPLTGSEVAQEQLAPLLQQIKGCTDRIIPLPPPTGREWTVEGGRLHSRPHSDLQTDRAWTSSCVHVYAAHLYALRIGRGGIVFYVAFSR